MENFDAKKFAINLKWKMGVLQILNALPFLALTLSTLWMDEMGLGRILLALVLFFTFRTIIILVYNKKLYALLHDDLAPGRLLDVLREGKIYSRNGVIELHAYLAAGQWQRVADICAQKLNDPQYRLKKHVYMGFLADMYFNLADDAHLREVCDAFDAYVAASKPDAIMQQMKEPMAYYRNYLDGAYEKCFAYREKTLAQAAKAKPNRYATVIRNFEHAVVCFRAGHMEEAQVLFERVVADAPQLALATLSEEYLRALREGGEPCFGERVTPSGQDGLPPIPKSHRVLRGVIKVLLPIAIGMLALAAVLLLVAEILL